MEPATAIEALACDRCRHSKGYCTSCPSHPPRRDLRGSEGRCCCGNVELERPLASWTDPQEREVVKLIRTFDRCQQREIPEYEFFVALRGFFSTEAERLGVQRPELPEVPF